MKKKKRIFQSKPLLQKRCEIKVNTVRKIKIRLAKGTDPPNGASNSGIVYLFTHTRQFTYKNQFNSRRTAFPGIKAITHPLPRPPRDHSLRNPNKSTLYSSTLKTPIKVTSNTNFYFRR